MSDECSCATFKIESNTHTIYLTKPNWNGEDRNITKDVTLFDFWDDTFTTVDKGLDSEPLRLEGIETVCGINEGVCFPFCFPFCFSQPLSNKFGYLNDLMNKHEEVKITGLGDCMDAYYVVRNFRYDTIKNTPGAYKWSLELEFKKEI